MKKPNFYTVIIGTELLNGRRSDKHFDFVNSQLLKRGWEQKASFIIKDEPKFIEDVFRLVKNDPNSVMFSFGGIGATPDDHTREVAAKVFSDGELVKNEDAFALILEQFGKDAYPHRVDMANIPKNSSLLQNVVNKVPGFFLEERFFFVPGFPSMAWPMITEALDRFYPKCEKKFSCNFIANASENELIDIMKMLPEDLEFSSLPQFIGEKKIVEIYIADNDEQRVQKWHSFFKEEMKKRGITEFN
jgi:molybdopterin-biosynthesis enzyme MoeA-like protein